MATKSSQKPKASPAAAKGVSLPPGEVLTLAEAAAFLRVPEDGLKADAAAGHVPGRRVAGAWRFVKATLLAWLSQPEVQASTLQAPPIIPPQIVDTPEEHEEYLASIRSYRDEIDRVTGSGKYARE